MSKKDLAAALESLRHHAEALNESAVLQREIIKFLAEANAHLAELAAKVEALEARLAPAPAPPLPPP
jgi:BMFP domain-containing protein YqiC